MNNLKDAFAAIVRQPVRLLLVLTVALTSTMAAAQMTGQTVRAQHYYPDLSTTYSAAVDSVVGAGVEVTGFPASDPWTNIDYSANSIRIAYTGAAGWSAATFNGVVFSDLNSTIPAITGVTLNPASNMVGLDASRLTFTADTVSINWQNLAFDASTVVVLDLSFANGGAATPVPTLSEWMLIVLMLMVAAVGITWTRRRH
ncbi:MAG: IPTL-CTERM sorting domain-containing protein [Burkholderiaceae bacterium]|nr:IPTL-CTERM sorting domain-containing protein [Burkholderiaceae bacterium]